METTCYYIHALTALHAGTGQGTGVIDLPIAREKSTGLPIVPGSGIKGVLRDTLEPEGEKKKQWEALFGPSFIAAEQNNGFAGALAIQDAHLLCLPVRSIHGVFAWVTCPFVLERYQRDIKQIKAAVQPDMEIKAVSPEDGKPLITSDSKLDSGMDNEVFLEDLDFKTIKGNNDLNLLAKNISEAVFPQDRMWQKSFSERFMVVDDNTFSFLADTATEVRARIVLQPGTRTVKKGGLWYEENLPAETILWGVIGCDRSRSTYCKKASELMHEFTCDLIQGTEIRLQIGGGATVGRGNVRYILDTTDTVSKG